MIIGTVLLSSNDKYVGLNGELPNRPEFDKAFLLKLIKGRVCICSLNTYLSLPKSVLKEKVIPIDDKWKADLITIGSKNDILINLGIKTFKLAIPNIMYIVRSDDEMDEGKDFDTKWLKDNFNCLYKSRNLEIHNRID